MANLIEDVFEHAFAAGTKSGKYMKYFTVTRTKKPRLFVTFYKHDSPTLDRDAAAFWATESMSATALQMWFEAIGIEKKKDLFSALKVSPSTLSRATSETTLDPAVTERMLRQSELFVRAAEVFGEDGPTWMTKPHELLGGKSPLEYATNEFGGAKVRQILNAIEYGGVV